MIFIHLAQSRQELAEVARRGYQGAARYLDAIGVLGPDVVAAHCIYLDDEEIRIPGKLLKQGVRDMVRISDARMSGTAFGTIVLHVAPESAVGGPLALVQDGDEIMLDVLNNKPPPTWRGLVMAGSPDYRATLDLRFLVI